MSYSPLSQYYRGQVVYIICRSLSIADRWAIRNGIHKDDVRYRSGLTQLRELKDKILVVCLLQENDSPHFREEVARERIYHSKIVITLLD